MMRKGAFFRFIVYLTHRIFENFRSQSKIRKFFQKSDDIFKYSLLYKKCTNIIISYIDKHVHVDE